MECIFVEKLLDELRFPVEFQEMVMQCITTASFSLSLNGEMFGYHPMCKQVQLANLMFADDVLLFCNGDAKSIMLLLQSYSTFSKATGLKISVAKSNAYFRGIPDQLKQDILSVSGFAEGKLPFKIHGYGAKKFSYAGRLVLVKAVLTTLHSYWASLFVLPKGILAKVEATCRNFLWDNCADCHRVPLVAWDTVCRPKVEGGLGIKNLELMNKALIGKLVNWIAEDKDTIWVKWVKNNHLKGQTWLQYKPSTNTSWVWRRICRVKQDLAADYTNGAWDIQGAGFCTASCYQWLLRSRPKISWGSVVWNEWVVPKHQFMGWLLAHGAFRTKDKLIS
ncbi:uncharacterized protein LOC141641352 [Silene latifolia]|uniref:uncharacterized protein LOC141641352 n=1 Tax=Silene latifolia TaxID=37657 RepID=UPI003D76DD5B